MRGECLSSTVGGPGIHQWFSGGNHDWFMGFQGANLQNLERDTVVVYRQPDDQVCPQVRVRVWKRGAEIHLPAIMR
jgi:hypothetical protein